MKTVYLITERVEDDNYSLDAAYIVDSLLKALNVMLRDHGNQSVDFYWCGEDTVLLMRNGRAFARIEEVQLEA